MSLLRKTDTLPDPKPKRVVFMLDRDGRVRDMGERPRLTWGERLLGGRRTFYEVDTNPRRATAAFDADVSESRRRFQVALEITYRVFDPRAFIEAMEADDADPDAMMTAWLRQRVVKISRDYNAVQSQTFERRIQDILDPELGNTSRIGPFEFLSLIARVEAPEGVDLDPTELMNLKERYVAALSRGEKDRAEALKEALDAMQSLKGSEAREMGEDFALIRGLVAEMERLIETGAPPDSPVVRDVRARIGAYSARRAPEGGEDGPDIAADAPPRKVRGAEPADRGDD